MAVYAYIVTPLFEHVVSPELTVAAQRETIENDAARPPIDEWLTEEPVAEFATRSRDVRDEEFILNRLVGKRLLAKLQQGDSVVVADVGSLAVRSEDFCSLLRLWQDQGVALHVARFGASLTGEKMGTLVRWLELAIHERLIERSERAAIGLRQSKSRGGPRGGQPPVGYKHVGKRRRRVVADNRQLEAMRLIVELKEREQLTFYAIAKRLNEEGRYWRKPKPNGARGCTLEPWDHKRVKRGYEEMLRIMADERSAP